MLAVSGRWHCRAGGDPSPGLAVGSRRVRDLLAPSQTRGCRGCEAPGFGRGLFSGASETPAGRAVPQQMFGRLLGGRTWSLAEQELCLLRLPPAWRSFHLGH